MPTRASTSLLPISAIKGMSPKHFLDYVRLTLAQDHGRALSGGLNVLEKIWQID